MTVTPRCERTLVDRQLRDAFGQFATGVAVVTTVTPTRERIGATISSFNAVSLQPPLILFSVARQSKAFTVWRAAQHFAVNVLAQGQSHLSAKFARALSDKWDGVQYRLGRHDVPLLIDSLISFECDLYAHYDGGDHLIVVGRVAVLHACGRAGAQPLLFFRSKYEQIADKRTIDTPVEAVEFQHGW